MKEPVESLIYQLSDGPFVEIMTIRPQKNRPLSMDRAMRVQLGIRVSMVPLMDADPSNGIARAAETAHKAEQIFKRFPELETMVAMVSMEGHGNPKAPSTEIDRKGNQPAPSIRAKQKGSQQDSCGEQLDGRDQFSSGMTDRFQPAQNKETERWVVHD